MTPDANTAGASAAIIEVPRIQGATCAVPTNGASTLPDDEGFPSRWARALARTIFGLRWEIRTEGLHHVPLKGGALFVANHPSPADVRILETLLQRRPLFVLKEEAPTSRVAIQAATEAIRQGQLVFLFGEGQVSQTGQMLPFGTEAEEIMRGLEAPIIPVGLTIARACGRGWSGWRQSAWVHFGAPHPATTTAVQVRSAVQELVSDAWEQRAQTCRPIHRALVESARRHPFRFAMSDARVPRLGFLSAPAVAVNTHDFRAPGLCQVGAKRGSIGHPLPGIAVRIVDPVTEDPVQPGQPGLLLVRGPNVMQGYLGRPDLTERVLRHGWYVTGDIATMDNDGFLRITDRLSRFSKIGGEMVPHLRIEERLHGLVSAPQLTFVVTSVPDERKGERLVVLHTLRDDDLRTCLDRLAKDDLPNLWKPKPDVFFRVESFPLLGSGKLDLRRIKELAQTFTS